MQIIPLGAGQDVGRSCILTTINGKTIMFDCGMHMGYNDQRRFPDFSFISRTHSFDKIIDCIIISHFHLDHCGALPYFTEVLGYSGPIYMTHPTKAVCPILLEDYRKIISGKVRDGMIFTSQDITNCMNKVVPLNINETFEHDSGFIIRPYYAGHVLGAAMFYVCIGDKSIVYTGDYNTTPDRHLGGAWIDKLYPDVLITESTYGSVIRECRKAKEREFLNAVHECIDKGGKVLIPIFALGRAQELCLLLDSYWERMGLEVPVYFSAGLTEKANQIYKLFINYTNETIKEKILERNMFDFKHIKPYQRHYAELKGPMVVFASPGMLHSGMSLNIFRQWCGDSKNLVIIPGYCVRGTVGEKILNGANKVDIGGTEYEVNMAVKNLAFSAHADEMGILQLIEQCSPRNVVLVHGELQRMKALRRKIQDNLNIPTYFPGNGSIITIPSNNTVSLKIETELLRKIIKKTESSKEVNLKISVKNDMIVEAEDYIEKI
ncbi:Integrator complex subunit 11 [Astathelohania contejeani]|uniref:Integrator complex subunit 11 n=1 Tax=Astathelohania contejeani TaxID=164912 RepID=A0ABQ7I0Y0_9MICR|nr:Integrator complex subunit 11 [Thelohania contejeani]